jgi:hypothetical protein
VAFSHNQVAASGAFAKVVRKFSLVEWPGLGGIACSSGIFPFLSVCGTSVSQDPAPAAEIMNVTLPKKLMG